MVDWMQSDPTLARHLAAGEYVFHCGEPGRHMYVVRRGSIDILDPACAGAPALIRQVQAGDIFGEIALIENVHRRRTRRSGGRRAHADRDIASYDNAQPRSPCTFSLPARWLSRTADAATRASR
jgi:CRP-like cAMP-binding protein